MQDISLITEMIKILILPQSVEIKITKQNIQHYKNFGYQELGAVSVDVRHLNRWSKTIIKVICNYCNNKYEPSRHVIKTDDLENHDFCCSKCARLKVKKNLILKYGTDKIASIPEFKEKLGRKKKTIEEIDIMLNKCNLVRISEYIGVKNDLIGTCKIHTEKEPFRISLVTVSKGGTSCSLCTKENSIIKQRMKWEEVQKRFSEKGCILLSKESEYLGSATKLRFICSEGHVYKCSIDALKQDEHCYECGLIKRNKENHWNWKNGITSENDKIRKSKRYIRWRNSIYKRDEYTCQSCLSKNIELNAHHILDFASFENERLNIDNGITMCEKCHSNCFEGSLHSEYGTRNVTPKQLIEYIIMKRKSLKIQSKLPRVLEKYI